MPKFHPTYRSESLCKVDSRNVCLAKCAGTTFRFPCFNPKSSGRMSQITGPGPRQGECPDN